MALNRLDWRTPPPAQAVLPTRKPLIRRELAEPLTQLVMTGGPLFVGLFFPIGVPLYPALIGPIGNYNCLFFQVTGHPCPACGLTSSVISTMHGRWDLALGYHPAGIVIAIAFLLGFAGAVAKLWALKHPGAQHRVVVWLMTFPSNDFVTTLMLGVIVLYTQRVIGWIIAAYS